MKKLLIGLFLLSSLSLFSQNIELIGGVNKNVFFNFPRNQGNFSSSYNADYGFSVRIGVDNIKNRRMSLRFTLGYDKYGGELTAIEGGLGGSHTTEAKINKSIISLGLFPLNFRIINKIDLNIGVELARLIYEQYSGTTSGFHMGHDSWSYNSWSYNLADKYDHFNAKTYVGIVARIAYDFNISDKWAISPQYSYYLGLSDEFKEFPETTKSMRHNFCIGIQRKIK